MQKRFRIWQNFRCTRLYTNTRSSTTWRIADQIRSSFVSFSKHVRSLSIPVTPFENEMKSVSWLHPSAEAVNFEFTLLKKTAPGVNWRNHSSEQLKVLPADRRWSVGRTPEMTWRSKRIETETSWRCHSRSNARWILESSSLEALGMKTASWKLPKSPSLFRLSFFFFFFYHFRCFFFVFFYHFRCFFCQKADPQASETKKRSRSYIPVVHLHSVLALATTCTLRVLSQ